MIRYSGSLLCLAVLLFSSAPAAHAALREYQLVIARQEVRVGDKRGEGMTINGGIPGPTLSFSRGDLARIRVRNDMDVPTSIHWHGILVPPDMDGVPFVTQVPIKPGTTFTYEFPVRQTGTYWYHSHSELQEQSGLYGSIVIADEAHRTDRDHVVLLSDWTSERPASVLRTLKRGSHWYALEKGSSQSLFGAARAGRLGDYLYRELQRMPAMDLADIAYDYFLANGNVETTLAAMPGETVRLRLINGSATTYFHVNYAGGPMTIISADGQLVEPVRQDLFLIGVAETYDVIVTLPAEGAYEFRATAHDGSGFSSTWLGSGPRHRARSIPKPNLYEPMEHGDMGSIFALTPNGTTGMTDAMVEAGMFDRPGMAHALHDAPHPAPDDTRDHADGHDGGHGTMPSMTKKPGHMAESMQHRGMEQKHPQQKDAHGGQDMHKMETTTGPHSNHAGVNSDHAPDGTAASPLKRAVPARPFGTKFGWLEADIASRVPLAGEGGPQRPLTPYPLLKSLTPTALPDKGPTREIRLTLDGDMQRYTWFINDKPISESDSIRIREGEVVRFIMINRTMMHHPMHLHGHFFRVLNGRGDYAPLKHTVDVAPMATTVIEFYGNEVGDWFFHCHLLYHMKSGMARVVHYEDFQPADAVAEVRQNLYRDPFYFHGWADIMSHMTEGALTLENSRLALDADWKAGWQHVEDTEWEGLVAGSYHLNRFTSFFLGVHGEGEGSDSERPRWVAGSRYLLPFNIESAAWIDTGGGARFMLEREFELTPRIGLLGEVEYDTREQWEATVILSYLVSKHVSLLTGYHSEFGFGAGLQIRF